MTEDFEASVEQLSRRLEEQRADAERRAAAERRRAAALQALLQRAAAAPGAFDDEDRRAIQAEIAAREAAALQVETEMAQRAAARREKETVLLKLQQVLQQRVRLLDEADAESGVLSEHAELLRFFADKQLTLTKLLQEKLRALAA